MPKTRSETWHGELHPVDNAVLYRCQNDGIFAALISDRGRRAADAINAFTRMSMRGGGQLSATRGWPPRRRDVQAEK